MLGSVCWGEVLGCVCMCMCVQVYIYDCVIKMLPGCKYIPLPSVNNHYGGLSSLSPRADYLSWATQPQVPTQNSAHPNKLGILPVRRPIHKNLAYDPALGGQVTP